MADHPCPHCRGTGLDPATDALCLLCGGRSIDPDPPYAPCPSCGRLAYVDPDGDLAWHRTGPTRDEPMCAGSFYPPTSEAPHA